MAGTTSRVLITGFEGRIAGVLRRGLPEYALTGIDRPTSPSTSPTAAMRAERFVGQDAVLHLAWVDALGPPPRDVRYETILKAHGRHLLNVEIAAATLQAACEAKVPRIILASSVHADAFQDAPAGTLLDPGRLPRAVGPYGAAKVLMEEHGWLYACRGLDVICLRLGGVTADDQPHPTDPLERRVWLSHADCVAVFRACLEAPIERGRFTVFYAVSENEGRLHDLCNPFGWQPRDGATAAPSASPSRL